VTRLTVLLAVVGLLAAACGGAGAPGAPAEKPPITVASFNFAESQILAEAYGQVLEANGYTVQYKHKLGNREIVFPALEKGDINFVPEYLATVLAFVTKSTTKVGDAAQAHKELTAALGEKKIATFEFSSAVDTNAFVVTKATAQKYNLKKMSDLAAVAKQLVLGAPPECPQRPFCIQGLKTTYGIEFKEFKPLDAGGPLTVVAVESGQVDVGLLFSTDAQIAAKGFVLLEDDKKLQAADNVVPVVRQDVVDKGGKSLTDLVNGVSRKLTTDKLTALNAKVSIDKKDPRDVAKDFLKAEGLIK
jgi:osmoprotectant transport system substrate-binding protein